MKLDQLDTPSLLIDRERLLKNLADMQRYADSYGVQLRPHTKTHKMPAIAKLQLQQGACGVAAAKTGEAEVLAENGLQDVFIANEIVGEQKLRRIAALAAFAEDQNAIVGLCTSGSFNVLGNDGRCSIISVEIGFDNLGDGDVTSTHGNESSFELIVELNPDYIFVLDRDAAIATEGAKLAQEIVENELVMETDAYKNGHIVYLAHPTVWYTAEGGITALDIMLQDLESALGVSAAAAE